ncbi:restriction endonuclease [Bacillus sp. WOD8 KX774193]|uniref:restriction endonuclease n=1 Tax=Bacillus TaxID=1386 RepID=UPI0014564865|nr:MULTISPECIES: restriction endonuclease [Bacillus]MDA2629413.1 restriction endonuclease [Bacillus cereus]MEB5653858.1 restriction endonuclease [Bacillus anthracis]MEC3854697.1 restriction endonuclease [Bacillus sp. WOD8 KX774193]
MSNKFPKDIADAMRSTILSVFWPKKDILSFFEDCGCTRRDLQGVKKYKVENMSRAQIIDVIFESLRMRDDNGLGQFRCMLNSLINWQHFDPYFFKELKKLDEDKAIRNINHLKQLQEIRDEKLKKSRRERQNIENTQQQKKLDFEVLCNQFTNLYRMEDQNGKSITIQQRGYLFEEFIKNLCIYEAIPVSSSFKIIGEQIDGAIKINGENYIIEAKWQDALIASNALYQFAYKVEGKFYGRGIFISINGYSPESVDALKKGKALNTILVDAEDLIHVIERRFTFKEIIEKKVQVAQTMGGIYINPMNMKEK